MRRALAGFILVSLALGCHSGLDLDDVAELLPEQVAQVVNVGRPADLIQHPSLASWLTTWPAEPGRVLSRIPTEPQFLQSQAGIDLQGDMGYALLDPAGDVMVMWVSMADPDQLVDFVFDNQDILPLNPERLQIEGLSVLKLTLRPENEDDPTWHAILVPGDLAWMVVSAEPSVADMARALILRVQDDRPGRLHQEARFAELAATLSEPVLTYRGPGPIALGEVETWHAAVAWNGRLLTADIRVQMDRWPAWLEDLGSFSPSPEDLPVDGGEPIRETPDFVALSLTMNPRDVGESLFALASDVEGLSGSDLERSFEVLTGLKLREDVLAALSGRVTLRVRESKHQDILKWMPTWRLELGLNDNPTGLHQFFAGMSPRLPGEPVGDLFSSADQLIHLAAAAGHHVAQPHNYVSLPVHARIVPIITLTDQALILADSAESAADGPEQDLDSGPPIHLVMDVPRATEYALDVLRTLDAGKVLRTYLGAIQDLEIRQLSAKLWKQSDNTLRIRIRANMAHPLGRQEADE